MKVSLIFALVASLSTATHAFEEVGRDRNLRAGNVDRSEVEIQSHRELWGSSFSFTNILCKCFAKPLTSPAVIGEVADILTRSPSG